MVLSGSITKLSEVPPADASKITADTQLAAPEKGEVVAILSTTCGDIGMKFFPDAAPMAVNNFIGLAKAGKYDGTIFHRVIRDFMIQGGDYTKFNGTGGASVYGQSFGYETSLCLSNIRGAVAMAHSAMPASNGSQFYINQRENTYLDGSYTVFGQVYDGMDVVDKIACSPTDPYDRPLEEIKLTSVRITAY